MTATEARAERLRSQKRRWMAAARARQRALSPTYPWRAEEYEITKWKRATKEAE